MPNKPILIYRLTPAQIDLVDRLFTSEGGVRMDRLSYSEIVAYQELEKLRFADMQIEKRRRVSVILTDLGAQIRRNGYFSKKPVVRLTEPQMEALHFLGNAQRYCNDIPAVMKDVFRRLVLRGWAEWHEDQSGIFFARITEEGRQVLQLVSLPTSV